MGFHYHYRFPFPLLLIPLLIILYCLPSSYPLSFHFSPLGNSNPSAMQYLKSLGNVSIEPKFVELTWYDKVDPKYSAGHLYYKDMLSLWNSSTQEAASFNCSFQFQIYRQSIDSCLEPGDGLTFFLLERLFSVDDLNHLKGGGLGLGDASRNGTASAEVVAVEFDTYQGPYDPDDNHIGIDVNSIISAANTSDLNFNMASSSSVFSWVDYSSSQSLFEVYASNQSGVKPSFSLLSYPINLTKVLPQKVYIGFSAATGACAEYHQVLSWSFNSTTIGEIHIAAVQSPPLIAEAPHESPLLNLDTPILMTKKDGPNISLLVGLAVMGICVAFAIILLVGLRVRRQKRHRFGQQIPLGIEMTGLPSASDGGYGPRELNYKDLSEATNNFSKDCLLGRGGFGPVYKGVLHEDRIISEVAVKCISEISSQGEKEFFAEVSIISRIRHKNLVQLKGWCRDKGNLLLVYEFLCNGSLDTHLFGKSSSSILDWSTRYNVLCGLGSALQYLHQGCQKVIVHRDIKASNVMLDANYNAKLGDFGLARQLGEAAQGHQTLAAGTPGYMAPEIYGMAHATPESDVYSYGIVLLEVACGRRPLDILNGCLLDWVWHLHGQGRLKEACDVRLGGAFDEEQLVRTLIVGLACSHPDPKLRPPVQCALMALLGQLSLPTIPTLKPKVYYGPPLSASLLSTTSTSSS